MPLQMQTAAAYLGRCNQHLAGMDRSRVQGVEPLLDAPPDRQPRVHHPATSVEPLQKCLKRLGVVDGASQRRGARAVADWRLPPRFDPNCGGRIHALRCQLVNFATERSGGRRADGHDCNRQLVGRVLGTPSEQHGLFVRLGSQPSVGNDDRGRPSARAVGRFGVEAAPASLDDDHRRGNIVRKISGGAAEPILLRRASSSAEDDELCVVVR
jgi:hypothetical protein